jgi:serine/threonine-protein kinase ATR
MSSKFGSLWSVMADISAVWRTDIQRLDTLRTHVKGVLTRNPDWEPALAGFQAESAWMVGAWTDVQSLVDRTHVQTSPIVMARLLLAMRTGDNSAIGNALSVARSVLGIPITAAGVKGYRRCYDAVLNLHLTHELEMIHNAITTVSEGNSALRRRTLTDLSQMLSARLDASLPTFRIREPILSMRRTAFALSSVLRPSLLVHMSDKFCIPGRGLIRLSLPR